MNLIFSKSFRDIRKKITPPETGQKLATDGTYLISFIIFSNGNITVRTTGVLKFEIALPQCLPLFLDILLFLN